MRQLTRDSLQLSSQLMSNTFSVVRHVEYYSCSNSVSRVSSSQDRIESITAYNDSIIVMAQATAS